MALLRKKKQDEAPAGAPPAAAAPQSAGRSGTFLPRRERRRGLESLFTRVVATGGIVGIGTAVAAIMGTQDIDAWIIGLVVAALSVSVAAVLWSSRTL